MQIQFKFRKNSFFPSITGGLHSPPNLVTMLEYCLVSGYDWWDLTICAKPAHLEAICERLTADFYRQMPALQQLYWSRLVDL